MLRSMKLPWKKDELPTYAKVEAFFLEKSRRYPWIEFFDGHHIFQLWNKEYIAALAQIMKGIENYPGVALEVCAGDGTLSHWLREEEVWIKATDNFSRKVSAVFPVERIDAVSAIKRYNPKIVVASWIDAGYAIDLEIAKLGVENIILIGEGAPCTGSEAFWEGGYKQLGYYVLFLSDIDKFNICRTDYYTYDERRIKHHSSTCLFQKNQMMQQ